jgi:uncharacterized SAM-binding protein YcdF (DUF218 family)
LVSYTTVDNAKPSDAIFVFDRSNLNSSYNHLVRIQHAVLYKRKMAPKLIFSGGTDVEDNANEAETMKRIAIDLGVPEKNIIIEYASTSTYENLSYSKKILLENKINSIILVTEPFHIGRVSLAYRN